MARLINEMFAIRSNELMTIVNEQPTEGRWIAVQLTYSQLPGEAAEHGGFPISLPFGVIAAEIDSQEKWYWIHLSPTTKEFIGDLLYRSDCTPGLWYYATIQDYEPEE
jgi:hypothetical protein